MSRLVVIATSRVPEGARGALTKWYLEVLPGIFVGSVSVRVREQLWSIMVENLDETAAYAVEVVSAPTDQGFTLRTLGDHPYQVADFHGLLLVSRQHRDPSAGDIRGLPDPTW